MNRLPFLLLAAILSLITGCKSPDTTTEEGLGISVFEAIKKQDTDALYALVLKESDRDRLLKGFNARTHKHRQNARGYMDYKIAAWAHYKHLLIPEIRREGQQQGVSWNTVTYDSIVSRTRTIEGITRSDITVYFHPTRDGIIGRLVLDDCLKTERGWVLFDDVSLQF